MDRQQIKTRILDNLSWAVLQGTMPKPPEQLPVWPRIQQLWPEPTDEFVRGAFNILFERDPDPAGREQFRQYLNAGGSRVTMIAELANSVEARTRHSDQSWLAKLEMLTPEGILEALRKSWEKPAESFIMDCYNFILGREPEAEGLNACLGVIADGQSRGDIVRMLASSVEYKNRGIATDWLEEFDDLSSKAAESLAVWTRIQQLWPEPTREFIHGVYQILLNREPDASDLQGYGRFLDESARATMVAELAATEEARSQHYDLSWVSQLSLMTPEGIRSTLQANWTAPTLQFVDLCYQILLDRAPDPEGLRTGLVLLANGGSKEELIRRLAASGEYCGRGISADWINEPDTFSANGDLLEPVPVWSRIKQLWPLPTDEFIGGVYRVLFKREADSNGLAAFRQFLNDGGSRATMVAELAASEEARDWSKDQSWLVHLEKMTPQGIRSALRKSWDGPAVKFIDECYQIVLDRPVDIEGTRYTLGLLADGNSRGDVVRIIVGSSEYKVRGIAADWVEGIDGFSPEGAWAEITQLLEQPDEAFVRGLYILMLDRFSPRLDELELHLSKLKQGLARTEVIRGFAQSEEASSRQVNISWLDKLKPVSEPVVVDPQSAIVTERLQLLSIQDRGEFVRSAYRCLLGREPNEHDLKVEARRVRIIPFYRRRLLKKLVDSREAQMLTRKHEQQRLTQLFAEQNYSVHELIVRSERSSTLRFHASDFRHSEQLNHLAENQAHATGTIGAVSETVTQLRDQWSQSTSQLSHRDNSLHQTLAQIERRLEPMTTVEQLGQVAASIVKEQVQARASSAELLAEIQELHKTRTDFTEPIETILDRLNELGLAQANLETAQAASHQSLSESAQRQEGIRELLSYVRQAQDELAQREDEIRDTLTQIRQSTEQHWFAQDRQLDQLRRLTGNLGPQPTPQIVPIVSGNKTCRICGEALVFRFAAKVLHDRYDAEYFECTSCHALQIPNPTWLGEAYANEDGPQVWNPDTGRFMRNFSACSWLRALQDAELIPSKPRLLDFGGGYGMLVQMLHDAGFDAWQWDPEVPVPLLAPERSITNLDEVPDRAFDIVTAFEVFEHLTDPIAAGTNLRRVLRPGGLFLISTGLYDPEKHGPDWQYLSRDAGQHVTFWSRQALGWFAARFGFQSVGYFPGNEGCAIIMADVPADELRETLERAMQSLYGEQHFGHFARCWEFDRNGIITPVKEADVHPIRPLGEPS